MYVEHAVDFLLWGGDNQQRGMQLNVTIIFLNLLTQHPAVLF